MKPLRNIRVDDETWQRWKDAADRRGQTLTAWLHDAAAAHLASTPPPKAEPVPTDCKHPRGARVVVNADLGIGRCGACGDTIRR